VCGYEKETAPLLDSRPRFKSRIGIPFSPSFAAMERKSGSSPTGLLRLLPNPKRHPSMRWDAFVYAPDPDALAADFVNQGAAFSAPLALRL
jgi:hypothetical protein